MQDAHPQPAREGSSISTSSSRAARLGRRDFLLGLVSGLAGVLGLVLARRRHAFSPTLRLTESAVLSDSEVDTLTAFSHVLLPSSMASGQADGTMREVLRAHETEAPAFIPDFRAGVAFLEKKSQGRFQAPFAELDLARRRLLVEALFGRSLPAIAPFYFSAERADIARLWHRVAKPILFGFYRSSLGWGVVGYTRRPGECGNLIDYQFPLGT